MAKNTDIIPPSPSREAYEAGDGPGEDRAAEDSALFDVNEPYALFADWLKAARAKEPNDPNAMALATVDETGLPDVRMVLLKEVDATGFVFYTNLESQKGNQLLGQPRAALCFHWKSLRRQVRVRGSVQPVSEAEADAYFASRARDSQIGAWASAQSRPLEGRFALEAEIARHAARFGLGPVPRPPHWSGFRLVPERIEFWRDRAFRLHDRRVFLKAGEAWRTERLYP